MRIRDREIGPDQPPYIIAELGVNHDGSVERAVELTRAAHAAGADAIKLQLFQADLLMSRAAKLAAYQKAAGESDPVEMLRRLELSVEQMRPVVSLAHDLRLHAIVTVFSVELVPAAESLPCDAYKTASPDVINKPLLDALMATGRPMIISTGASTLDEVRRAIDWLSPIRDRLAVLQCVSAYPTPPEHAALGGIGALQEALSLPIGYSDHTSIVATGAIAARLGAAVLEKHLTYRRRAAGPDHAASLEPDDLARYAALAREARQWSRDRFEHEVGISAQELGPRTKAVLPVEHDVRTVSRQSLTTTRNLAANHRLSRADLTIKRPGTGIPPFELDATLGRTLARPAEADMPLTPADLQ